MRAGGFAEERVIELVNRRYIPFYYEVSGRGCAASPEAARFVAKQTRNPHAFLAAFAPDGTLLGETALYADKDAVFEFLRAQLVRHSAYDEPTAEEQKLLTAFAKQDADAITCFAAGELFEELGSYSRSARAYERALASKPEPALAAQCEIEWARIARYARDWDAAREHVDRAERCVQAPSLDCSDRIALERAYHALARSDFAGARAGLEAAIEDWPGSRWLGEMRFQAGVACYFAGERDLAKYHWCWVCENIPDDRLYQRCRFSATCDKNPYPNPEIGRNDIDLVMNPSASYSPGTTVSAYAEAKKVYDRVSASR